MKVFLENFNINLKILIIIVFFITILTIAFTTYRDELIPVNGQQKELPIYSVDCPDKKVAITFDCAWGAGDIPDILSTLKKENIKATFFIVGQWAQKFPAVVKSISDEGHDIANHSDTHVRMGSIDKSEIISELSRCSDKLQTITGKKVCLFRAPYGEYNDLLIRTAKNLGYYTIQWDVDSLDWKPDISQDEILKRVSSKVRNGSIILFHNDTKYTAQILPTVIKTLKNKGFNFVPVSKLIYKDNYYLNFEGRQIFKGY